MQFNRDTIRVGVGLIAAFYVSSAACSFRRISLRPASTRPLKPA